MTLSVVVGTLKDGSAPFSKKPLRHPLNVQLGPLALGVEENHLADAARHQSVLLDRES